jgi:hypothetical protein
VTALEGPDYPYLEVFSADDGYDVWRVTREDSTYQQTYPSFETLVAALQQLPATVVTDTLRLADALREQGINARQHTT